MKNQKIFHLVTVSKSIPLMRGQIEFLRKKNMDVHIVSSDGKELKQYDNEIAHVIPMKRDIALFSDLKSLLKMILLFHKEKPFIVNSGTPKAGLIGTIAAFITQRPIRIYTVRGLRLETVKGFKYFVLYLMEKIAMFCATDIIAISESLKHKIITSNLAKENKITVLGFGSSNGIQFEKFQLDNNKLEEKYHKLLNDNFVIGYVGRIVKDKGIHELIQSFKIIVSKGYNVKLLVIGSLETENSIDESDYLFLTQNPNVVLIKHVSDPISFYNNMNVFVFPTHREGFGNVSIEAQALEVPVITTNVTGAIDTVVNGETGFIVEKGDFKAIAEKIEKLINDESLRETIGHNGRKRVENKFSSQIIWEELESMYNTFLKESEGK
ncbi:putative capsular polysaccharide biosynthesis protein [Staphylococcus aureus]|uniref:Capsular polysaccharide biosynthesis glycosyltransferase CapM n=1 Tax=Staphylococcus aureus TaxID=1280 RepID=CAPM_STAAU|nr:glycosyltransferase family 4 protein [Staphylococcus aureus]P39862.1 RecName: Full=Capsular polysaccharide biosynthesis glycosyltransferase CapM [Staphylococcus aureus]AAA64652.1 type 1 capsule synthesis gene [Staphylococcus aureus]SUJ43641.1 putative capsular polysaccharide biosynthesis protein [Staphylococcus aureus]